MRNGVFSGLVLSESRRESNFPRFYDILVGEANRGVRQFVLFWYDAHSSEIEKKKKNTKYKNNMLTIEKIPRLVFIIIKGRNYIFQFPLPPPKVVSFHNKNLHTQVLPPH